MVYSLSLSITQGDGEMRVVHFDLDSMVDLSSVRLLLPKDLRAVEGRAAVAKSMKEAFRRFVPRATLLWLIRILLLFSLSRLVSPLACTTFVLGCLLENNLEFTKANATAVQWECRLVLTAETGLLLQGRSFSAILSSMQRELTRYGRPTQRTKVWRRGAEAPTNRGHANTGPLHGEAAGKSDAAPNTRGGATLPQRSRSRRATAKVTPSCVPSFLLPL